MAHQPYTPYSTVNPGGAEPGQLHVDVNPNQFGAQIGAAGERMAQGLEQAGSNLNQVAVQRAEFLNQVGADQAFNNLQTSYHNMMYGDPNTGEQGFYSMRGEDALKAYPKVSANLETMRNQIKASLPTQQMQLQFDQASRRLQMFTEDTMGRHYDQQSQIYALNVNKATVANNNLSISTDPANETNYQNGLHELTRAYVRSAQVANGMNASDDIINDATNKAEQDAIKNRALSWANKDPSAAYTWLQSQEKKLDPVQYDAIQSHLKGLADKAEVSAGANAVIGGGTKAGTIEPEARARAQAVHDAFVKRGYDDDSAWAWAANALHESAGNPHTGPGDNGASHGLFMWRGDRLARFEQQHGGKSPEQTSLDDQVDFAIKEMASTEGNANKEFNDAKGADAKARIISSLFLRPKDVAGEQERRAATAVQLSGPNTSNARSSANAAPGGPSVNSANGPVQTASATSSTATDATPATTQGQTTTSPQHTPEAYSAEAQMMSNAWAEAQRRFPDRPDLQRQMVGLVYEHVQQTNTLQAKYEAEQQKALHDQQEAAGQQVMKSLMTPGAQFDPATIRDNPYLTWQQKDHLWKLSQEHYQKESDHDVKTYGSGFWDAYQKVHALQGDPGRITDPSQLWSHGGPGGDLTLAGIEKLTQEIQGKRTPEGEAWATIQKQFLETAKQQITHPNSMFNAKDPKGDELFLKFLAQTLPAIEKAKSDGKQPGDIFNPDSKDYIGKSINSFKRPMNVWMQDLVYDNPTDNPSLGTSSQQKSSGPDLTTQDGIVAAYRAGKINREQATKALIDRGFARAPTPKPPEPKVPTNG